ncbi:hypothetical protein [Streptococcus ferus]|uniref:hypothetical protein n=1 Tax=Streptococcus ferus TaxID=1345 RepID=UPI0035A0BD8D
MRKLNEEQYDEIVYIFEERKEKSEVELIELLVEEMNLGEKYVEVETRVLKEFDKLKYEFLNELKEITEEIPD